MVTTLVGLNSFTKKQRLYELVNQHDVLRFSADDGVTTIVASLGQTDLFGTRSAIIIDNPFSLSKNDQQTLAHFLAQQLKSEQAIAVVVDSEQLPKSELSTLLQQSKVEHFAEVTAAQLVRWIKQQAEQRQIDVEPAALSRLALQLGGDQMAIARELDRWQWLESKLTIAEVEQIMPLGGEASVFSLTDAWMNKKLELSLVQLQQLWRAQVSPAMIVSMLERQVRQLYICHVASETELSSVSKQLALPQFVMTKTVRAAKSWSTERLVKALQELHALDAMVKTSRIEPAMGLERWVIVSLSGKS